MIQGKGKTIIININDIINMKFKIFIILIEPFSCYSRQFRLEEKDENGDVFGKYGYFDDKGKMRVVKYSSKKNEGFRVL
jgi:hypothetical protein